MHLPHPAFDSAQFVDLIVAERQSGKNAAFFNALHEEWKARVEQYVANSGSPEFVTTWPEIRPASGKFLNLYASPADGSSQKEMLLELRDHKLNLCPACGEAGRPNTLDHYLPKSKYPHFCITPSNLFPMCDACQDWKDVKTGNANSPRFFIHPYFDVFVFERVLELSIHEPYDAPTFSLIPCQTLTTQQISLVASHIRELGIHVRSTHFFSEQHRRMLRLVGGMRRSGLDVQVNMALFCNSCSEPSKNSWEHVYYSAVLSNQDLMDYLINSPLPQYL